MGLLNDLSIVIARLPLERLFIRGPNRIEQWERLGEALANKEEPPRATPAAVETHGAILERHGLDPETMKWQLEIARAELWALEGHLKHYCKGCGAGNDCCFKHSQDIIDIARETKSMTTDPIWDEIVSLGEEIREKAHPENIKTGKYFDEFPQLVVRVSELRRPIEVKLIEITKPEITLEIEA